MTILEKLVSDIKLRQTQLRADRNIYTHYLKEVEPVDLISISYPFILKGLERQSTLTEIISVIGKRVRQKMNLPDDPVAGAQVGWFVCISYIECKVLNYKLKYTYKNGKKSKYQSYFFTIKDWKAIDELWSYVDTTKVEIYPLNEPSLPWDGPYNADGMAIIKKGHITALNKFKGSDKKFLFDALNTLQAVGWKINSKVFEIYKYFLNKESLPSPFKLHNETNEEAKKSLLIEANAILRLADKNIDKVFYHVYNFDFRGRIYVNTAFLHEQSSDNAKGLLLFDKGVPLGDTGLFWLKVHASNCYGNDKVSLEDRAEFINQNIAEFLSYGEDPIANQGWINTESPFCFLACCVELYNIKEWIKEGCLVEDYMCHLPIYIDGSNNGVQHLVAMSKDEEIAHLVNLVPQEEPGDVYMYIANYVWEKLKEKEKNLTEEERTSFDSVFNKAKELQRNYQNAPDKSEQKAVAYGLAQEWRNKNRDIREKLFPVYWLNIDNPKDQRKVVKRNVMTLGYGGTPYGMGQQIIDDTKDMSDYLRDKEHLWGAMLGNLVFDTCYEKLPGPAKMLRMFQDLADRSNQREQFLEWITPVTGFPVVQAYRKPRLVRTKLKYGEDELKIQLQTWNEATIDKDSQKTGAAPNIVHSFDAAHLTTVINDSDYQVTVVHDSFGTLPGNMDKLFKLVRQKFVDFYNQAPLEQLLVQLDSLDLLPELGELNVGDIMESDYAFC